MSSPAIGLTINLFIEFKVSNSAQYEDIKSDKNTENGVIWGSYGHSICESRSLKIVPFDIAYEFLLAFHSNYNCTI